MSERSEQLREALRQYEALLDTDRFFPSFSTPEIEGHRDQHRLDLMKAIAVEEGIIPAEQDPYVYAEAQA